MKARFPGWCPLCGKRYAQGAQIVKYEGKWHHDACCPGVREVEEYLNSAERFMPRRSSWRRGKSPGSYS